MMLCRFRSHPTIRVVIDARDSAAGSWWPAYVAACSEQGRIARYMTRDAAGRRVLSSMPLHVGQQTSEGLGQLLADVQADLERLR